MVVLCWYYGCLEMVHCSMYLLMIAALLELGIWCFDGREFYLFSGGLFSFCFVSFVVYMHYFTSFLLLSLSLVL